MGRLIEILKTKDRVDDFLAGLDRLGREVYKPYQKDLAALIREIFDERVAEIMMGLLSGSDISSEISHIREYLQSVSCIRVTLAVNPDEILIDDMHKWCRQNLGNKIVIDPEINPRILGGVRISYNGIYYDGSLMAAASHRLNKAREEMKRARPAKV